MFIEESLNKSLKEVFKVYHDRICYRTSYFGIKTLKNPADFWVYQELIHKLKPDVIIEIGVRYGGSTLALAHLMDSMEAGRIIGIDINLKFVSDLVRNHPRISLVEGDACDVYEHLKENIKTDEYVLVIEDSSHTYDNTLSVLRLYSQLVKSNGYIIVEDSVFRHGIEYGSSPGSYEAIETFINENSNYEIDRSLEGFVLTSNPKGFIKRI